MPKRESCKHCRKEEREEGSIYCPTCLAGMEILDWHGVSLGSSHIIRAIGKLKLEHDRLVQELKDTGILQAVGIVEEVLPGGSLVMRLTPYGIQKLVVENEQLGHTITVESR